MQQAENFNDVVIVSIKGSGFRINFWYMTKDNAKNCDLNEKGVLL